MGDFRGMFQDICLVRQIKHTSVKNTDCHDAVGGQEI